MNTSDTSLNSSTVSAAMVEDRPAGAIATSPSPEPHPWQSLLEHHSQLIFAVVQVGAQPRIVWANDYFYELVGVVADEPDRAAALLNQLQPAEREVLTARYRRHLLNGALHHRYGQQDWVEERILNEAFVVSLPSPAGRRYVELRLRQPQDQALQVQRLSPEVAAAMDRCWTARPEKAEVMAQLQSAAGAELLGQLAPGGYQASGYLLLEGTDVSDREIMGALIELLFNQESLLEPGKFNQARQLMRQLFRADDALILSAEQGQATLFTDLEQPEWRVEHYELADLQASHFWRAYQQGQVLNLPDLAQDCRSQAERQLVERGARSLLVLPLAAKSRTSGPGHLLGLVGLISHQPYGFHQGDCSHATTLTPALATAMRHTVQNRFTTIHPAVRWRFEQEAERRSWGLTPEPVVFAGVHPLYGISDIRGSSEARNQAIQEDLTRQFQLALAVVDAVGQSAATAFAQQLQADLQNHLEELGQGVTVDGDVTLLRYLHDEVEVYFDYFQGCSEAAADAIATYRAAKDPHQGCVYAARAVYDRTITQINALLRDTWGAWQQTMQGISPHYCDVEATDGIDHMIYAGQAIDPSFTPFHLRSLRYDQLRAVCACARAAYTLKQRCDTDLEVTHLVLVQASTVDITHDERTDRLFDVCGTRDTRYEIVKKRIDKARDAHSGERITQPGRLTVVYSTQAEWQEYERYLRYLQREQLVADTLDHGQVEPLQGVNGLKYVQVRVLPA